MYYPVFFCHVAGVCSVRHQYYHCGDGDGDGDGGHDHSMAAHGQSPEVKQVDIQMGTGLVTPKPRAEDQAQKWGRNGISAILTCIIYNHNLFVKVRVIGIGIVIQE